MTTLGEYLRREPGTFVSPNHPVPVSGEELLHTLQDGTLETPGAGAGEVNLLDAAIETVEQPSGEIWVYLTDRRLEPEGTAYLIHQPA